MACFPVQRGRDEVLASWWRYARGRWDGSAHLWLSGGFKLSCKVKRCQQEKLSSALLAPFAPEHHLIRSGQSSKGHKVGGQTPLHGGGENIRSPASQTNDLTAELLGKGACLLLKHPRKTVLHCLCLFYWCPKRKMFYLGQMDYWCSASSNSSALQRCRKIENTTWSEPFPLIFLLGHQTREKMLLYTFKR